MGAKCVAAALGLVVGGAFGQAMPAALRGDWQVEQIIARGVGACWDAERAKDLLGSRLRYDVRSMTWKGGTVAVQEALSRVLTADQYSKESKVTLAALGLKAARVTEVDLQHEDADVTGSTTEVPGDTVLLAGPRRIVVSACGVYFLAVRMGR